MHVPDSDSRPDVIGPTCPCIGHCSTTLGDDVCRGCLRTLDEVTRWPLMNDDERTSVNLRIVVERNKLTQHS